MSTTVRGSICTTTSTVTTRRLGEVIRTASTGQGRPRSFKVKAENSLSGCRQISSSGVAVTCPSDASTCAFNNKKRRPCVQVLAFVGVALRLWLMCSGMQGYAYMKWLNAFPHLRLTVDAGERQGERYADVMSLRIIPGADL